MTPGSKLLFPADQVLAALYHGILGRTSDEEGHRTDVRLLQEGKSLAEIVQGLVNSTEFELSHFAFGPFAGFPPNPIQFDLSAQQRELIWRHISKVWSRLGKQDPYFSVITSDNFRRENMSTDALESFYNSGEADIQRAETYLARHGRRFPQDGICVDYGCGLGRTTLWLARRCKRVLAVDVSEAHLRIARQALAARGVNNVEFRLLRRRRDLSILQGIDFFHSVIVLQHNPPPIIVDILQQVFDGLNNGGSAFFQVPTYGLNYTWDFDRFVTESRSGGGMEMHALPQSVVFALASRAGCLPVEVQPDGSTGTRQWVSNTFLFVKPDGTASPGATDAPARSGFARRLLRRIVASSFCQRSGSV